MPISHHQALSQLRASIQNPTASFRSGQWEAIDRLVNQRGRMLVVQRTGWGKSAVYFLSTYFLRKQGMGMTLIISPLLALMRNQLEAAAQFGLSPRTINSTNKEEWAEVKREVLQNKTDILFISPERLANENFNQEVLIPISGKMGLFVVDEAHCISNWGHDFRVDYRRIVNILRQLPANLPLLATTATANDRVIDDIESQLGDILVQRGPLERTSLHLQTLTLPDQPSRLAWLAQTLPQLPGTGIVYVLTKRDAEQVSAWLVQQGIDAHPYYSDAKAEGFETPNEYRIHLENLLLENKIKVLVATTALSMGYDKPDLAFVIHYQAPGSIVGYYQQVGRAGRGIDKAYGILLAGKEEEEIHDFFRKSAFPSETRIQHILSELSESEEGLSIPQLTQALNYRRGQIEQAIKYMSVEKPSPVFKVKSKWQRTAVPYQLDKERVEYLTQQRYREWKEVEEYLTHEGCLMAFLRGRLDDPDTSACGRCANCLGHSILPIQIQEEMGKAAAHHLRRSEFPLKLRKQIPPGAKVYGLSHRIAPELQGEEGRILSRWKDAGWGSRVAQNKADIHFDDALVAAMAQMIDRWSPEPFPQWLTCVPSLRHPALVPNFAQRLAERLGIPFHPVIVKIKETQPQKLQENSYFQCVNLDEAFDINSIPMQGSSVFLLDDAVDSAWTLTILSALLRKEGSGPVFPIALTSTRFSD